MAERNGAMWHIVSLSLKAVCSENLWLINLIVRPNVDEDSLGIIILKVKDHSEIIFYRETPQVFELARKFMSLREESKGSSIKTAALFQNKSSISGRPLTFFLKALLKDVLRAISIVSQSSS